MAGENVAMDMVPPVAQLTVNDEELQEYVRLLVALGPGTPTHVQREVEIEEAAYGTPTHVQCEVENEEAAYAQLFVQLKEHKKVIEFMEGKGESFFRAFAHQYFNDPELHPFVRLATILFMRSNPTLYTVDFAKMHLPMTFEEFLDSMSGVYVPVPEIIMQGACDAFSVAIFRLSYSMTKPMRELYPKNMIYHRELSMSFVPTTHVDSMLNEELSMSFVPMHVDSMFNEGEIPPPLRLSDARIEEIRKTGAVRYADIAGCVRL